MIQVLTRVYDLYNVYDDAFVSKMKFLTCVYPYVVKSMEQKYFDEWLCNIHDKYSHEQLNHFEHNLEVWRQLWRVLERSDKVYMSVCILE